MIEASNKIFGNIPFKETFNILKLLKKESININHN